MSSSDGRIVVLGAGGHAREILDVIEACAQGGEPLEAVGFIVDAEFRTDETELNGLPILGDLRWLAKEIGRVRVVCGIGLPEHRFSMTQRALSLGARFASLVHPSASVTRWVERGEGSVLMAGARLTNRIHVGAHCHVNQNCTVGHDAYLGAFVSVFPGANISGNVVLEEGTLLGAGAVVAQKVRVGAWSRVGAGSVVLHSLPANVTAVGAPATVVRTRAQGWYLSESAVEPA